MRKEKGITLIALIITIIIMLILVGVVIGLIIGEKGIFKLAKQAGKNYTNAENNEKRNIEDLYSSILIATNDDAEINISVKELKTFIREEVQNAVRGESVTPIGTIIAQMGNEAPAGYINCDGTIYNISEYKQLAEYIKNQFGRYNYFGGDGEVTFAVPDLRGEFLRGTGTNSHIGNGSGAAVGTHQQATQHLYVRGQNTATDKWIASGSGNSSYQDTLVGTNKLWVLGQKDGYAAASMTLYNNYTARPTNTSVLYCIKY